MGVPGSSPPTPQLQSTVRDVMQRSRNESVTTTEESPFLDLLLALATLASRHQTVASISSLLQLLIQVNYYYIISIKHEDLLI